MVNAKDTMLMLNQWFDENYEFWLNNTSGDNVCVGNEKESFRRAFEWDLIDLFKHNHNVLHEYDVPNGDILDTETCINFFKIKCQDLYGQNWKEYWKKYAI